MKKILGLTALVAVLVLAACGGNTEETVCTANIGANELILTAQSEDGEVTSVTIEEREDVSDLDSDRIDDLMEFLTEQGEDCNLDGDSIVCTEEISGEELRQSYFSLDLEEFIADMEVGDWATCE